MRVRRVESVCKRRQVFYASVVLAVVTGMGCNHPVKNALHVTSVTPDAAVDVVGTLNGQTYALSVDRRNVPLYIAYYEPIGVQDVGKDFPAQFDKDSGEIIVQAPGRRTVRYSVRSVSVTEKN